MRPQHLFWQRRNGGIRGREISLQCNVQARRNTVHGRAYTRECCPTTASFGVASSSNSRRRDSYTRHAEQRMSSSPKRACARRGCLNIPPIFPGPYKHVAEGLGNANSSKKYGRESCSKLPGCRAEQSSEERAFFCAEHAGDGTVDAIPDKRAGEVCCTRASCSSAEGGASEPSFFCAQHADDGKIAMSNKKCRHKECHKRPSYGVLDSGKADFCAQHAEEGLVNVVSKKCARRDCPKIPIYGVKGSGKRVFCAEHADEGMVNVGSKKCAHEGCSKIRTYGVEGSRKREYCAQHAVEGMVDFSTRKCASAGCYKRATYGKEFSGKREFCAHHAEDGMVNVDKERCASSGCCKRATYGTKDSQKREFCSRHAKLGMVRCTAHTTGVADRSTGRGTKRKDRGNPSASTVIADDTATTAKRPETSNNALLTLAQAAATRDISVTGLSSSTTSAAQTLYLQPARTTYGASPPSAKLHPCPSGWPKSSLFQPRTGCVDRVESVHHGLTKRFDQATSNGHVVC